MALNLEQHMAKHMTMKFLGLAVEEWDRMYHNASMHHCRKWPEYEGEKESKIFWEYFMQDIAEFGREGLESDLQEQFGFDWKLSFYGRMGATLAPMEIINHCRGRKYGEYGRPIRPDDLMSFLDGVVDWSDFNFENRLSFDMDDNSEMDDEIDWPATYHATKHCYEAFKHINQYCKDTMEYLPESWEQFKLDYPDMFESDNDDDEINDDEDDISAAA